MRRPWNLQLIRGAREHHREPTEWIKTIENQLIPSAPVYAFHPRLTTSRKAMRATALAGRRIDAVGADTPRFPLERAGAVRDRIRELMVEHRPDWLVSSAACGSDLLAQEIAAELRVQRRVVLPFHPEEFRRRSVVDRPGEWGPRFDRLIGELESHGNLVDLGLDPDAADVYTQANEAILEQAVALSGGAGGNVLVVVVWEGRSRGDDDYTAAFAQAARRRTMTVTYVLTT